MYILPDLFVREIIEAFESDVNIFPANWVVRLYTNNVVPQKTSTVASFTELTAAEVPGYAPAAPVWDKQPNRNPDGSWEDYASESLFIASSSPSSPTVVYGWFATDSPGANLLGAGALANPFVFANAGDGFRLQPYVSAVQSAGNLISLTLDMLQS